MIGTPLRRAFKVTAKRADATHAALDLSGDLDVTSAEFLSASLREQLALGRRYVRLSLSGLDHVDRAGLAALSRAHDTFLANRGTLILTDVPPHIGEMLRAGGLDTILLIANGTAEPPRSRRPRPD